MMDVRMGEERMRIGEVADGGGRNEDRGSCVRGERGHRGWRASRFQGFTKLIYNLLLLTTQNQ